MEKEKKEINRWFRFGLRLGVSSVMHPFYLSRTLVQIGYEPVRARLAESITGSKIHTLPNMRDYVKHIRYTNGLFACYRGVTPTILGTVLSAIVSERIDTAFNTHVEQVRMAREAKAAIHDGSKRGNVVSGYTDSDGDGEDWVRNFTRDLLVSVAGIVVSQPFRVISNRMIAQLIGKEVVYETMLGTFGEIVQTEGWTGLFSGLVPEICHDVAFLTISSGLMYLFHKYCTKDKIVSLYNNGMIQMGCSSALYPLRVIATCMSISGANLRAAAPPFMPAYNQWYDCFFDLNSRGALFRGCRPIWRTVHPNSLKTAITATASNLDAL